MSLCQAALDLIIGCEVTSPALYERRYRSPTWPGGSSGVTIGIGWDLGYEDRAALDRDWSALPDATRNDLAVALGVQGEDAHALCARLNQVVVPWDVAVASFRDHTLPRYEAQTLQAFPGCDRLPAECYGALVSLVYNRGPSCTDKPLEKDPQQRRKEMRLIREAITAGRPQDVPDLLRAMKRLWSNGLVERREKEAALFERGLAQVSLQPVVA